MNFFPSAEYNIKKAGEKEMAEEIKKHSITAESRNKVQITGVTDVLSFDEECVTADTSEGALVLRGRNLHISTLELEKGVLVLDGELDSFSYEHSMAKSSVFARIFR